jgi:hypothetical protein
MQNTFDKVCLLMAADALAAYLDHNKWLDVYTDASNFQLGACIIQEGRPIAYFLHKLTKHDKLTQSWLCQYPCPVQCLHDKGGEFIRQNFQWLLEIFTIKDLCSTSKNPQSNAICERMHQTVNNVLRTLVHTNPPQNMTQARDIIDDALGTAMHAMQTTVATT